MKRMYASTKPIFSDGDIDEEDYDLPSAHQNYSSKKTAVNALSGKLPAIFKMVNFPQGSLILDYGGGRPEAEELANAFLADKECQDLVYDEYWTDDARKAEIRKILKKNGGADLAICSNVLNVIDTYEARIAALQRIKMMTKPGAPVYITVYEGKGTGEAKQSGDDMYQNNKKTADYLEEIQEVFPDAKRKGKLIVCTNSKAKVTSNRSIKAALDDEPEDYEVAQQLIEIPLNCDIIVYDDNSFDYVDDSYSWAAGDLKDGSWSVDDDNIGDEYLIDKTGIVDDIDELLLYTYEDEIPSAPGTYHVSGTAKLYYDVTGVVVYHNVEGDAYDTDSKQVTFNKQDSKIDNLSIVLKGNDVIQSSSIVASSVKWSDNAKASKSGEYDMYQSATYNHIQFGIHYKMIDNSPEADEDAMYNEFKAFIREYHPYDDGDYATAKIRSGVIQICRNGRIIQSQHYFKPSDMDVENYEWVEEICNEAIIMLREINGKIAPKMMHN